MDRLLVFAPHPDDEAIGCGGVLCQEIRTGVRIKVVVVTDGAAGLAAGGSADIRREESILGLRKLGVTDCEFWAYPDGNLPFGGDIAERYRTVVERFQPTRIMVPHPAEQHIDHRILTRGLLRALESRWQGVLWFYETTYPCRPINRVEDVSETIEAKLDAIAAHGTQLASFDYQRQARLLAELHGGSIGCLAGEAYLVFEWNGEGQQFFAAEPLVSVIVRASDRDLVEHALQSLAQQSYPWVEIVLVWFGEHAPPDPRCWRLPMQIVAGTRNRSANLNAGLDAATGELVGFLDEDDILHTDHLMNLVEELVAQPRHDIAFTGCRVVACERVGGQVIVQKEVERLDRPYQPGRLLFGNYMTLHSLLARRSILKFHRFAEELPAYEDWDLLAALEQAGASFVRVDGATSEYRLYPEPGEAASIEAIHGRKQYPVWRHAVRKRIAGRMTAADIMRLERLVEGRERKLAASQERFEQARAELREAHDALARQRDGIEIASRLARIDPTLPDEGQRAAAHLIARGCPGPLISVVFPVFNTAPQLLESAVRSVLEQSYPHWQLCLVDDASTNAETCAVLDSLAAAHAKDSRIRMARRAENGGIVGASNDALAMATGDYIAFLDHDDLLMEDALLQVALSVLETPGAELLYTDGRTIDHVGNVLNRFDKPDWSPETLLSYNYVNHLTVVARPLLLQLGGLRQEYSGCQDWDMLLQVAERIDDARVVHIRKPLYDWRATDTSVSYSTAAKPWMVEAAKRTLGDAITRRTRCARADVGLHTRGAGFVSTWDAGLSSVTVIVDIGAEVAQAPDIVPRLREALAEYDCLVVVPDGLPSGRAARFNRLVSEAETDAILIISGRIVANEVGWLDGMLRTLALPGVGAVGAMLSRPDGELWHGGIVTDPGWISRNISERLAPQETAAFRNVSAVSAACLLTTRSAWQRAGGFDESMSDCFLDVDYCLALRQAGLRIVMTSVAHLSHDVPDAGAMAHSHGDAEREAAVARMQQKWGDLLKERYRLTYAVAATTRILKAGPEGLGAVGSPSRS